MGGHIWRQTWLPVEVGSGYGTGLHVVVVAAVPCCFHEYYITISYVNALS